MSLITDDNLKHAVIAGQGLIISGHTSSFLASETAKPVAGGWIPWGKKDQLGEEIRAMVMSNHIAPSLLDFKTDAVVGQGIIAYKARFENGKEILEPIEMPAEIFDFLEASEMGQEASSALTELACDFAWFESFAVEFKANKTNNKVLRLNKLERTFCRLSAKDSTGKQTLFYGADAKERKAQKIVIPPKNNDTITGDKFARFYAKPTPGYLYYPPASWHGVFDWLEVSNRIPSFKKAGMDNAMGFKYMIKIPNDYFLRLYKDEKRREEEKKAFEQALDEFLTGVDKTQKSLITYFEYDAMGKEKVGVQIVPIEDKTNYEAHLTDDERATSALVSAFRVSPTLANILIDNKLSSGSEILNAFNIHMTLNTHVPRQYLLQPLYEVKKLNGWDKSIRFGFRNIQIQPLEKNPNGVEKAL
jgi:hypothetical protein